MFDTDFQPVDLPELHDESIMFENWEYSNCDVIPLTYWKYWHNNEFLYFHHKSGVLFQIPVKFFISGTTVLSTDENGYYVQIEDIQIQVPFEIFNFLTCPMFADSVIKAKQNLEKYGSNY